MEPLLYYFAILQQKQPVTNYTYDIDHIVPQTLLTDQLTVVNGIKLSDLRDTLGNLALLPHKSNTKKSDNSLNNIDADLKQEYARYSDIPIGDFDKYSDVSKLPELCNFRKLFFKSNVLPKRTQLFANGKLV